MLKQQQNSYIQIKTTSSLMNTQYKQINLNLTSNIHSTIYNNNNNKQTNKQIIKCCDSRISMPSKKSILAHSNHYQQQEQNYCARLEDNREEREEPRIISLGKKKRNGSLSMEKNIIKKRIKTQVINQNCYSEYVFNENQIENDIVVKVLKPTQANVMSNTYNMKKWVDRKFMKAQNNTKKKIYPKKYPKNIQKPPKYIQTKIKIKSSPKNQHKINLSQSTISNNNSRISLYNKKNNHQKNRHLLTQNTLPSNNTNQNSYLNYENKKLQKQISIPKKSISKDKILRTRTNSTTKQQQITNKISEIRNNQLIKEYITDLQLQGIYNQLELANIPASRWTLLIVDRVYQLIKTQEYRKGAKQISRNY